MLETLIFMVDKANSLARTKWMCSSFMGYLKGKSALMMFERHANSSLKKFAFYFGAYF